MNIIALDIDDCILPTNVNYFGMTDDADAIFEINLKRLEMIIEKYNMKVFITSAWYSILTLENGILDLKYHKKEGNSTFRQFKLLNKHIGKYVIGLSCGNRETDIDILSTDNQVVILDDMDLTHLENENCLFCMTKGFISGNHGYKIKKFIEKK